MKRYFCGLLALCILATMAACVATADPSTESSSLQTSHSTQQTTVTTISTQVTTAPTSTPTTAPATVPTEPATIPTTAPTEAPTVSTQPTAATPTQSDIPAGERLVYLRTADYTYEDMAEDLQKLADKYPQWLTTQVYGQSRDGRDLLAATLGSPDAPSQVIITAGMHAGEYINPYLVMLQLEYYLYYYESGSYGGISLQTLFSQVSFVVVPMVNPDGITLVQKGLASILDEGLRQIITNICNRNGIYGTDMDLWIKTYWKSNAAGVDLNRNYDIFTWEDYTEYGGYVNQEDYRYNKGETPNSEPETYHLIALTESLSNPAASICVHSRGNIIYWRCYQDGAFAQENLELAVLAQSITGYGIIDENQYEPSYSNWTILAHEIPTLTVETAYYLPHPMDIGENIGEIYDRNRDLWAAIALKYQEAA